MKKKLEANIWKYAVNLVTKKRIYMSVFSVYLLTIPDSTAQTLGAVLLIGDLFGFVFELPSGYAADKLGHKRALVLSRFTMLVSTLCFVIGGSVFWFVLGQIVMNFALALSSGTGAAFMHDTLRALGKDSQYAKIMGKVNSIGFAIPIPFVAAIPFLVLISYRAAFGVSLIFDVIGLISVIALTSPKKTAKEIEEISSKHPVEVLKEGWSLGVFKYFLLLAFMMGMSIGIHAFKAPYQEFVGVPVIYFGVFWAVSRIFISIMLLANGAMMERLSFHGFLGMKMFLMSLVFIGLVFTSSPVAIVVLLIFVSIFNSGFVSMESQYMLDRMKGSQFKATLLSLKGLFRYPISAAAVYIIGLIIGVDQYILGYTAFAIAFMCLGGLIFLYILLSSEQKTR